MVDIKNLRLFKDGVGRLLIGEEIVDRSNEKELVVKNPLLIHMNIDPKTGQIGINFFPETFPEYLADRDAGTVWSYPKTLIAICDHILLDVKLHSQYVNVFTKASAPQTAPAPTAPVANDKVIKLFDK